MAKIIDNFEQLSKYIPIFKEFRDINDFWFIQIIKRRKDNPGLKRNEKLIENFFINGRTDLLEKKDKIIELCETNNARAYFRVNRRNYRKISLYMMKGLTDHIITGNYKDCRSIFLRTCGQYHSEDDKKWIVDIDEGMDATYVKQVINSLYTEEQNIMEVPTVSGIHLVVNPFNLQIFYKHCPNVDVHKDNPTLLYFKKLNNEEFSDNVLNEYCIL